MDPKSYTFDLCRRYVLDSRHELGDDNVDTILGWIRSRSIDLLASCSNDTTMFEHSFARSNNLVACDKTQSLTICRTIRQVAAFFKKNAAFVDEELCSRTARAAFDAAELQCKSTNLGLDTMYIERFLDGTDFDYFVSKAQRYIRDVLGDFNKFQDLIPDLGKVTAGATATQNRSNSLPPYKISLRPWCTKRAFPYLHALGKYYSYPPIRARTMEKNRVEFVPKNWKTHRTIACEPEGNMPLQLAFDTYVKKRLKKFNIDLSDQFRNQDLARQGSIDGSFATIDLSQASDTLSINTVVWLLPDEWCKYLKDVRSPFGKLNDRTVKYEKFSSMGNGSTFTLESLIFASLCFATGSKQFSVYGDDIIIETEHVENLQYLLSFFGFSINTEKSFTEGPFRESCGADWYNGINVTPFYLRQVDERRAINCHNINGLVTISKPGGQVQETLVKRIEELNLPFVPHNENTLSGVFVTPSKAYSLKLFRRNKDGSLYRGLLQFRGYRRETSPVIIDDSRSLFLWHFCKEPLKDDFLSVNDTGLTNEPGQSSRYARAHRKYVRRWSSWFIPAVVTPVEIYLFQEFIGL